MIPVITGIPFLAGLIGGLFSSVFSFVAKYLTKRLAVVVAAIAAAAAVTAAFLAAVEAVIATLTAVSPEYLTLAIQLVVPDNATTCLSAYYSAKALHWAYGWQVRVIQWKLF
ncbi:DUF5455 family protein [Oceanobacter sp. 3_MG-2023]|uniref:DUF5455 family protein n=1 Tax=Oceanobacter sp. 3_MG-2023 TaxID=3062622 RepID=UPI0027371F0B|nr:DUF5455 family protein [Oceanobacter sp. 3_MG-2023]MDP2506713.1 DUF5455 family protein [Oceanobacter sp. 3_MG-2023]